MAGRVPRTIPELGRSPRVDTLSRGAQKALGNMVNDYGSQEKAVQVFLDKAREQGAGSTLREKVNSTYKKGAKLRD